MSDQSVHDAAVLAERARIKSIVNCSAAVGKERAAIALALTGMSVAEAERVLPGLMTDAVQDGWAKSIAKVNRSHGGSQ